MRIVTVTVQGVAPISFGKHYEVEKLPKESPDHYEQRTWRNKLHVDKEGQVIIPPMMVKNALRDIGAFLNEKIPGKGAATYKKHFLSGLLVIDPAPLGIATKDVVPVKLFVPPNGIAGSGKRVWKYFPTIPEWGTKVRVHILDNTITREVFERHFIEMGRYVGWGSFRPQRGGTNGRFEVLKFEWSSDDE
jgi:hypothetical protein